MPQERSASAWGFLRLLGAVMVVLASAGAFAACGGGEGSGGEGQEAAATQPDASTEPAPTETAAQPPPESAAGGSADATTGSERSESNLAEDAVTGSQACSDVVITPNSGNGLFAVEAEGITCEDASAALQAWGESGYPGEGPAGFACEEVAENDDGSVRLSCEQEASGGLVEFETGS